ncbi:hypothetical protein [Streptomyces cyanogenus]|uniref:hypothetical protein n=1 Tax=Streptomyces cyanogenus TaxID=80860 RepID=UPI001AA0EDFA
MTTVSSRRSTRRGGRSVEAMYGSIERYAFVSTAGSVFTSATACPVPAPPPPGFGVRG